MVRPNKDRLNIFVDEFGNEDFSSHGPSSYGIALTFHDNTLPINPQLEILNRKLVAAGYTDMIHLADLIAKRDVYANISLDHRRDIFRAIYHFAIHVPIQIHSVVVDMSILNNSQQLTDLLRCKILEFFQEISPVLAEYRYIIIYYDKGQVIPTKVFDEVEQIYSNIEIRPNFNHAKKRLFQVSDMVTKLDKMQFDLDHGNGWTKGERYFFTKTEFREVHRQINRKRFPHG